MIKLKQPGDLAAAPADFDFKCDGQTVDGLWFEVGNLSPYLLELQDAEGQIRGLAGPFSYVAVPLAIITQYIRFHAVGTQSSSPLPSTAWFIYAGLTKRPVKGLPTIG